MEKDINLIAYKISKKVQVSLLQSKWARGILLFIQENHTVSVARGVMFREKTSFV